MMNKLSKNESKVFSLGIQFVFSVLVFWYLGKLVDDYFGTKVFQLIGILFGITGSFIKLFLVVKSINDDSKVNED